MNITIDSILQTIGRDLQVDVETKSEILEEIRGHFEDAVAEAKQNGSDEQTAIQAVAYRFGIEEVGRALQNVHANSQSLDVILACIIPIIGALILRWLVYSPDGSAIGWQTWLLTPAVWIIALVTLLIPMIQFNNRTFALASWGIFWFFSIIFIVLPNIQNW